jgi:hypothetical protein
MGISGLSRGQDAKSVVWSASDRTFSSKSSVLKWSMLHANAPFRISYPMFETLNLQKHKLFPSESFALQTCPKAELVICGSVIKYGSF